MSQTAGSLSLGQLHLHNEIHKLKSIGVQNLEQLLTLFAEGLPEIQGVGARARMNLLKIASYADAAISESGEMDWDVFAERAGFPTFPSAEVPLRTGSEFLSSLDRVVLELTTKCFDEVESATLVDRLIPLKRNGVTLEQLGRRFGVSRERIRQKQKKVIERVSAAVLESYYEGLSFRFTERFCGFWRAAAEYFRGKDSVIYNEFIAGITEVWQVERAHVIPHLPLIYAILTSNSTLPVEFNQSSRLPQRIFEIRCASDLAKPFRSLHPSKHLANSIEKAGVSSIELLLGALRAGRLTGFKQSFDRLNRDILDPLARAITSQGEVSWQEFYEIKGIQCIPGIESDSAAVFVKHAIETLATFIDSTEITGRSSDIFRLRIVPDASERQTLDQTGQKLGCQASSVKREENELLERLHDAIFAEDYTTSGACFRTTFIKHWRMARKIYRQTNTQHGFTNLLSMEWELPVAEISKIVPMIVCVVEGRPKGYTGKRRLAPAPPEDCMHEDADGPEISSIIRLRGFRSIH
jgi:transcriptional regulator with XRE-family HTH domain